MQKFSIVTLTNGNDKGELLLEISKDLLPKQIIMQNRM